VSRAYWLLFCYAVLLVTHRQADPDMGHTPALIMPPWYDLTDEASRAEQASDPVGPPAMQLDTHRVSVEVAMAVSWG
jgi:hypothetical protein